LQDVIVFKKPKSFGNCSAHPESKLELFCTVCNIPLCVYYKITGSHSKNESATHLVEKIEDAYKKTMIENKEVIKNK